MTKRKGMKTPVSLNRIDGGRDELRRGLNLLGLRISFKQLLNHWLDKKFYREEVRWLISRKMRTENLFARIKARFSA